ncbi:MAG: SGNH/GDSL hydrolase family protein [Actinomycetota bacterium]
MSAVSTRLLRGVWFVLLTFVAVLVVEVWIAVRREYLPTEPILEIGGTFGPASGTPLRFAVLGDSTAAGVGAGTAANAYPTLLAERLADDGFRVKLTALGVSGARVADLEQGQVARAQEARPDLVFVAIGANDVTHLTPLDDVEAGIRRALEKLRSSGAVVVVAGAPDMRAPAFLEPLRSLAGWRGRRVAATIEIVAEELGVASVPLAAETGHLFASDPERYHSADDFHPSASGYRLWADAIYPVLSRALKDR